MPCAARDERVFDYGEARAHAQITRKYRVRFRCICGPCAPLRPRDSHVGLRPYFVVEALDAAAPDAGLAMSTAQVKAYVRGSAVCKSFVKNGYSVGTTG